MVNSIDNSVNMSYNRSTERGVHMFKKIIRLIHCLLDDAIYSFEANKAAREEAEKRFNEMSKRHEELFKSGVEIVQAHDRIRNIMRTRR